ncbi:MAG: mitochondrial fission ELM1 family protein [Pseudomonadota bacterium]
MDVAPTCWIVTDGAAGNVKQCEALADALGADAEALTLTLRQPWASLVPYWRALGTLGITGELAPRLRGPWPELLLTAGRRAVLASTTIGRLASNVYRVHLLDPRIDPRHFDRVVCPRHDPCSGPNVTRTRGSLHAVNEASLATWRSAWSGTLGDLPGPRVVLLVGAGTRNVPLSTETILQHAATARDLAGDSGSLLVTSSRRTPPEVSHALRDRLGARAHFAEDFDENPYAGFLAWADRFVVTPDSVNMVSEALGTGRPVHTGIPDSVRGRPAKFLVGLRDDGMILPLAERPTEHHYGPLRECAGVATVIADDLARRRA